MRIAETCVPFNRRKVDIRFLSVRMFILGSKDFIDKFQMFWGSAASGFSGHASRQMACRAMNKPIVYTYALMGCDSVRACEVCIVVDAYGKLATRARLLPFTPMR